MDLKPLLVSVSGGKTSAFMAVYLKERFQKKRKLIFVYANTGREKEATLVFLNQLDSVFNLGIVWLEAVVNPIKGKGTNYKIVTFSSASRKGEPFESVISKYGLPSKLYRHCTRELKENIIHKYGTEILGRGYLTAIGIRADERHRLSKKENYIYPLSDINVDKKFINDWWNRQSFNLKLHDHEGNCDFCFLKSKRKRVLLIKGGLDIQWWTTMEDKYSSERQPIFDVRNNASIPDLVELANNELKQITLLDNVEFDCVCKSY